tara:strand:+ start:1243 stop:1947 length:705 start_codon:yes stop_codon:yes gene_type:complete
MIEDKKINLFEKLIEYKFNNKNLLKQSLTHPSFYINNKSDEKKLNQFERLEFLGDRVLGVIISSMLYNKFKNLNEGDLSKKFSYLVQKKFLYKISSDLLLDKIVLYDFKKNNNKMVISILSDSVESLIGSIFVDGGYNSSYNFIKKFWSPYLDIEVSKTQDPKTLLQEISQQLSKKLPEYKLIKKKGPSHSPLFTINLNVLNLKKIKAQGSSIREAETKAAKEALKLINDTKIT